MGGVYEVDKNAGGTVTSTTTYYPAADSLRVNGGLYFVVKDHLGSTSIVSNFYGNVVGEQRYLPYGQTRFTTGAISTDRLFTGQREITGLGIYHFNARFYSPTLGRFLSADTIVPGYADPQNLNRYSYVGNSPLNYTDPSGHMRIRDGDQRDQYSPSVAGKYLPKPRPPKRQKDWEKEVLKNLADKGGPESVHAVDYITQNNVHLVFNQEKPPAAWHIFSNDIYLDSDQYSVNSDPSDPYLLSLVVHEAVHLEQGKLPKAITVAGEVEAWQCS